MSFICIAFQSSRVHTATVSGKVISHKDRHNEAESVTTLPPTGGEDNACTRVVRKTKTSQTCQKKQTNKKKPTQISLKNAGVT